MRMNIVLYTSLLAASGAWGATVSLGPGQSITEALARSKPGDTITLAAGVYRETVEARAEGTQAQPIILRGPDAGGAVISGADPVVNWTHCTADDLPGAPQPQHVFRTILDITPETLFAGVEDGTAPVTELVAARFPASGWLPIREGLSGSEFIVAPSSLPPGFGAGWTVAILYQAGGGVAEVPVRSWDANLGKITLERPYSRYSKQIDAKRDRFHLVHHPSLLTAPGRYVIQPAAQGPGCTLYVYPDQTDATGQPRVLLPRRAPINLRGARHIQFENLEVAYGPGHGLGIGNSFDNAGLVVRRCFVHDNHDYGLELRNAESVQVVGSIFWRNSHGLVLGGARNAVVRHNDIGWNRVDGLVGPGSSNLLIQANYIHDHIQWGHPDNIQFWNATAGLRVEDTVLLNSGQGIMSDGMGQVVFRNNLFAGTHAITFIIGAERAVVERNTLAGSAANLLNLNVKEVYESRNNVYAGLTPNVVIPWKEGYVFDRDLIWACDGYAGALAVTDRWKRKADTLEQMRSQFGIELNGLVADPCFISAPRVFTCLHHEQVAACTASELVLKNAYGFAEGDRVEVDFDGLPRTVVKLAGTRITIDPPLAAAPLVELSVANWKNTPGDRFEWDLRLSDTSPGFAAGPNGTPLGANLSIAAYRRGDFDGDGKSDRTDTESVARWRRGQRGVQP